MHKKLRSAKIILLVILFACSFKAGFSQSTQQTKRFPFKPSGGVSGLTLVYVNFSYKVVNTFGMISIVYDASCTVAQTGYIYNGKEWYGFEEAKSVTAENPVVRVQVTGPGGISKEVNLSVTSGIGGNVLSGNSHTILLDAKTPEQKNPDNFKVTPIEVISVSYQNTSAVRRAIDMKLKTDEYNTLLSQADEAFRTGNWAEAKKLYVKAWGFFPDKMYPKEQLEKIKEEEAKAKNTEKFDGLVKEGDDKFNSGDYQGAKQKYEQASKVQPDDNYPKNQLGKIKQEEDKIAAAKSGTGKTAAGNLTGSGSGSATESKTNGQDKTKESQKKESDTTGGSGNTGKTGTTAITEEERKAAEDEKRVAAAALARQRKEEAEAAAEAKRIADAAAAKKRQEEYDSWKAGAQKERDIQDAASVGATIGILTYMGGFIYEDMGETDPYFLYRAPVNPYKPLFFMKNAFGFSGSMEPLLFQSDYSTMINGSTVATKKTTGDVGYYVNLGWQSNIGMGNDYYSGYGLLSGKLGIIPNFSGGRYNMSIGLGGDIGFKNMKFYTSYKYNAFDYKSVGSSDVEESGEGEYEMPSDEISYGLKFTFGGDKEDDYQRQHISIGFIDKSYSFDYDSYQVYYDPIMKGLQTSGLPTMSGYSLEWRKDHTFSLFLHYFEEHILVGNIGGSGQVNVTPGTDIFFEIGFVRALDFFSQE